MQYSNDPFCPWKSSVAKLLITAAGTPRRSVASANLGSLGASFRCQPQAIHGVWDNLRFLLAISDHTRSDKWCCISICIQWIPIYEHTNTCYMFVKFCIHLYLQHPTTCSSPATANLLSRNRPKPLWTLVRIGPGSFNHITGSGCSGECQKLNQLCITFWASIGRRWPCSSRHEVRNASIHNIHSKAYTNIYLRRKRSVSLKHLCEQTAKEKKHFFWPTWPLLPTPTACAIPSCLNGTPRVAARRSAAVKGHSSCTHNTRPVKPFRRTNLWSQSTEVFIRASSSCSNCSMSFPKPWSTSIFQRNEWQDLILINFESSHNHSSASYAAI